MKQVLALLVTVPLLGCVDSGPIPFCNLAGTGNKLYTGGNASLFPDYCKVDGGKSGSGGGGYGGYGGGYGGYGGSGGYSGSCSSPGGYCDNDSDCCQTSTYGNACIPSINQCAARCSQSSQCADYCCAYLDGDSVCVKNYSNCLP